METNTNWDFVDKIIYINLAESTERKKNIEEMLSGCPKEKIIRFNAIKDEKGYIGCSKSHIACIKFAIKYNWKNVLILEDDVMWNNYEDSLTKLNELTKNTYDVILLGGCSAKFDSHTFKLFEAQTAASYLVSNHYYRKLLNNFMVGCFNLYKTNICSSYALDQYWKNLQRIDNWYIVNPALVIQKPFYSYIEKKDVDYTEHYNK